MASSIYDYTGFYQQAKIVSDNLKDNVKTYTNREMLQKLYAADSVFLSSASRGSGNSTEIAASEILIDKKVVDSTEYNLFLSRFKNLPNITFAKGKLFHDNDMGIANNTNAQHSDFGQVDAEWVASRFMTGSEHLSKMDRVNRFFTTTGWKFDSTKWGQNMAINPRPQFTRTCDIRGNNRHTTSVKDANGNGMSIYGELSGNNYGIDILPQSETKESLDYGLGMGRYYSEAIDDNATQIYLQFGVPKFNSLISFFINAVSYEDSYIANYGRLPTGYAAGKYIFGFVVWCAFPLITTTIWILKSIANFVLDHPLNYYYMEPTMHTYWTSVNLIVNQLASELGIMAPFLKDEGVDSNNKNQMGIPVRISSSDIKEMSKYMPNLFNEDTGYIDIYHLATRGQALANYLNKQEYEIYKAKDKKGGDPASGVISGWYGDSSKTDDYYVGKSSGFLGEFAKKIDKNLYLKDYLTMLLDPNNFSPVGKMLQGADKAISSAVEFVKSIWASPDSTLSTSTETDAKKAPYSFRTSEADSSTKTRDTTSIKNKYVNSEDDTKGALTEKEYEAAYDAIKNDEKYTKLLESKKGNENDEEVLDMVESAIQSAYSEKIKTGTTKSPSEKAKASSWTDGITGMFTSAADAVKSYFLSGADTFDAAVRDGGGYAIFNVDYMGTVSESWSNSTGEIETAGLTKQVSKAARDMRFNLTGGLLATAVGQVVDGLKNFVMAGVEQISFGLSNVVASLLGGGYADLPKRWDDSDFSFPKVSYTMQLVAPYGNPISQLQNIYIPLAMIMAGSLPLQAGKSSYTSPFLCSIYNKGVQDIRLGMITDVSVSRGITNMPFSRTKRMLSCEVTFSVTDFSTRLVAPINSSPFKTLFSLNWDDDTPTGIYIATLASRDLFSNKYFMPKTKLKIARMAMAFSQMTSQHNWSMRAGMFFNKPIGIFAADRRFPITQRNSF